MQSQNLYKPTYWLWPDGLSKQLCDLVISESINMDKSITGMGADGHTDTKVRDSEIKFAPNNYWLEGVLANYAHYANINAEWNYKTNYAERVQIAKYGKKQHYDWHEDWDPLAINAKNEIRKLSVIALLSDPTEFKGGNLEFRQEHYSDVVINLNKGSVIVFPSYLAHRVTPVLSGTRYSAVCWMWGDNNL